MSVDIARLVVHLSKGPTAHSYRHVVVSAIAYLNVLLLDEEKTADLLQLTKRVYCSVL